MEAALTASMRRTLHEIFSGHFVSFVVKKNHCHPVTDALPAQELPASARGLLAGRTDR